MVITDTEQAELIRLTKRARGNRAIAFRARIVLACVEAPDKVVARRLRTTKTTVAKWRVQFVDRSRAQVVRRAACGCTAHDIRRAHRGSDRQNAGDHTGGRNALEYPVDGQGRGIEPQYDRADLADVSPAAPSCRVVQAVASRPDLNRGFELVARKECSSFALLRSDFRTMVTLDGALHQSLFLKRPWPI
jgi:hypothetical protein